MVYETFLNTIKEGAAQALGDGYELSLRRIPKNNGLVQDGLCISKTGSPVAPAIYLNTCYEQYLRGRPMERILGEILELYRNHETAPGLDCTNLLDFEAMKPRILLRLINRESNASLLQNMPHIPWLDLAIVFCLCLKEDDSGLMTASIYNDHLDAWGISQNDLWLLAMENTPRRFPPVITHMSCILGGIEPDGPGPMRKQDDALLSSPLYVLTNSSGIHGAACILYPQVLKNFAEGVERDLMILPSSIHEVLLLPTEKDISCQEMSRLVECVNQTEVPSQDRLSNQVYLYSREKDAILLGSSNETPLC